MPLRNLNIYFVRHGNAEPAAEGQHDSFRMLTEKGEQQARMRAARIGHGFDIVMASPTTRTQRTAMLVGGKPKTQMCVLESLLTLPDPEGKKILERMGQELGRATFAEYMQHANSETLLRFGKNAAREITETLMRKCLTYTDVLVVGHDVLTNVIISEMFPTGEVKELCLRHQLSECGAIMIHVDGDGYTNSEVFD